eukprot:CAMPEP_0205931338 /NCGR_PEP_ID=MMETSP1325-20131115/27228_1 /ASSEMBLY_ACC=CAM_ASM_000708 /TAXON_ID=236786 /ORGANISM="Florenciella sp., Strain RCC1007" /LENGTH=111 /DNA_ID=CAMNT_0053300895 /DNA_START=73 /DNA_END=408 /DNA_ORIENTATION=+
MRSDDGRIWVPTRALRRDFFRENVAVRRLDALVVVRDRLGRFEAERFVEVDRGVVVGLDVQVDLGDIVRVLLDIVQHFLQQATPDVSSPVSRQHSNGHDIQLFRPWSARRL